MWKYFCSVHQDPSEFGKENEVSAHYFLGGQFSRQLLKMSLKPYPTLFFISPDIAISLCLGLINHMSTCMPLKT